MLIPNRILMKTLMILKKKITNLFLGNNPLNNRLYLKNKNNSSSNNRRLFRNKIRKKRNIKKKLINRRISIIIIYSNRKYKIKA